jgi:hypothetical protein
MGVFFVGLDQDSTDSEPSGLADRSQVRYTPQRIIKIPMEMDGLFTVKVFNNLSKSRFCSSHEIENSAPSTEVFRCGHI